MTQNVEEVQEQLSTTTSVAERNEILRRAGVSIPTGQNMAPFRAVPRRPSWLAFLLRLVRYPD
jgi:hypothetical protein